jgi:hypothetical protein
MLQDGIEMDLPGSKGLALTAEQEWETLLVYRERAHRCCSRMREPMVVEQGEKGLTPAEQFYALAA